MQLPMVHAYCLMFMVYSLSIFRSDPRNAFVSGRRLLPLWKLRAGQIKRNLCGGISFSGAHPNYFGLPPLYRVEEEIFDHEMGVCCVRHPSRVLAPPWQIPPVNSTNYHHEARSPYRSCRLCRRLRPCSRQQGLHIP